MRLAVPLLLFCLLSVPAARSQVTALQTACGLGGGQSPASYQFVATCSGRALSPDGKFAIVQRAYIDKQPPIELQDAHGRTLATLKNLSDDMPFSVSWAPDSRWFYVNHHTGSFMDALQVFEIVGHRAVERPALIRSAVRIATRRYPCLTPSMVVANGAHWLGDSRRIVLMTTSGSHACLGDFRRRPGTWHSLWMIGDARNGRIDSASIRVQADDKPYDPPTDRAYAKR